MPNVQGDPNQHMLTAITLNLCIFDPFLEKPICVWDALACFENCKQTAENENKLWPAKRILALPTY